GIERRGRNRIDREGGHGHGCQTEVDRSPVPATIDGLEDSATVCTRVQRRRRDWIDGESGHSRERKAAVDRRPVTTIVRALENPSIGPGVNGGWVDWING